MEKLFFICLSYSAWRFYKDHDTVKDGLLTLLLSLHFRIIWGVFLCPQAKKNKFGVLFPAVSFKHIFTLFTPNTQALTFFCKKPWSSSSFNSYAKRKSREKIFHSFSYDGMHGIWYSDCWIECMMHKAKKSYVFSSLAMQCQRNNIKHIYFPAYAPAYLDDLLVVVQNHLFILATSLGS